MGDRQLIDTHFMRLALRLARRGYGRTSPNPMVGAVLVRNEKIIGRGWHRRAGEPHAEIEAIRDVERRGGSARGATLYVTLEPCSTHGRTPALAVVGASQGRHIDQMRQRVEPSLGLALRSFHYLQKFR